MFSYKNGKPYCRACIKYKNKIAKITKYIKPKEVSAKIKYSLSNNQENISEYLMQQKGEIYVDAVCGAGKTEIVFKSIENSIQSGLRVGFVIPRREVVIEICERLKSVYPSLSIVSVYGGHSEFLDGDIVCLTCHQCSRYKNKFGLLILDEYDAFPLKGDETLLRIVKNTCFGKILYLSATFSNDFLQGKNYISLNKRFHGYDVIVPEVLERKPLFQLLEIINFLKRNNNKPCFIYSPTIRKCYIINTVLGVFNIKSAIFTSKSTKKEEILRKIRNKDLMITICTSILERGITIENLNVVVLNADHNVFDTTTLIQICGRVGRKNSNPFGRVLFLCSKRTNSINECINNVVIKNVQS